jgi:hypothetical protein
MTRHILLLALVAHAGPAAAATDLAIELGSLGTPDATWSALSDRSRIPTVGMRISTAMGDRFRLVADWHHGAQGGAVNIASSVPEEDEWVESVEGFHMGLISDQISLGAEVEHAIHPWISPYATGRLLGYRSVFLMDDDTSQDDNPNQIRSVAFQPGMILSVGARIVPESDTPSAVQFTTHAELGYAGLLGALQFDNRAFVPDGEAADEDAPEPVSVGDLGVSGLFLRAGIGVRF